MSSLKVTLDGKAHHISPATSMRDFLQNTIPEARSVAVALNSEIYPIKSFESVQLKDGDEIRTIRPVAGG